MSGDAAETDPESAGVAPTADLMIGDASVTEGPEQMLSPVATKVFELLGPVVATANVELLDVEWTGGTLRVVLDHPDGVTTESLTSVNRLISPILDQHDPIPGRYTLEVSSPGVERPLRRLEHFRRAVGENIIIKTVASVEPRRFKGALVSVAESEVVIDVTEIDGVEVPEVEPRTVTLADISTARTIFNWGPTPKIGPKQGSKSNQKSSKTAHQKPQQQHSQRKAKKSAKNTRNTKKTANTGSAPGNKNQTGSSKAGKPASETTQTTARTESAQNRNEVGDE